MIPKEGECVDINPLFKDAYRKNFIANGGSKNTSDNISFGEQDDGHIHVTGVTKGKDNTINVQILSGGGYIINMEGHICNFSSVHNYGFSETEQFFVPLGFVIDQACTAISPKDLKIFNTKLESSKCAACGGVLKDIGLGPQYKHCPKCEP